MFDKAIVKQFIRENREEHDAQLDRLVDELCLAEADAHAAIKIADMLSCQLSKQIQKNVQDVTRERRNGIMELACGILGTSLRQVRKEYAAFGADVIDECALEMEAAS